MPAPSRPRPSRPLAGAVGALLGAKRRALAEDRDLHERRDRRRVLARVSLAVALGAAVVLVLHLMPAFAAAWAAFRAGAPLWVQALVVVGPIAALAAVLAALVRKAVVDSRERFVDAHFEGHRMVGLAAGDGGLAFLKAPAEPLAEALRGQEAALQARKVLVVNPHQAVRRWDKARSAVGHLEQLGCNPAEDSYPAAVADKHALRPQVVEALERWRSLGPDFRHVHVLVGVGTEKGRGHTGVSSFEVLAPEVLGRFPRAMVVVDVMTREATPPAVEGETDETSETSDPVDAVASSSAFVGGVGARGATSRSDEPQRGAQARSDDVPHREGRPAGEVFRRFRPPPPWGFFNPGSDAAVVEAPAMDRIVDPDFGPVEFPPPPSREEAERLLRQVRQAGRQALDDRALAEVRESGRRHARLLASPSHRVRACGEMAEALRRRERAFARSGAPRTAPASVMAAAIEMAREALDALGPCDAVPAERAEVAGTLLALTCDLEALAAALDRDPAGMDQAVMDRLVALLRALEMTCGAAGLPSDIRDDDARQFLLEGPALEP